MNEASTSFRGPCPCGHRDAEWRAFLQEVPGSSSEYLAEQVPAYVVDCPACGRTTSAEAPRPAP